MYTNSIKSRIRTFFSHLSVSQKVFNESIGVKAGFLNTDSEPTGQILSQIIKAYPQLSPEWLLSGEGSMIRPLREHPGAVDVQEPEEVISDLAYPYSYEDKQKPTMSELLISSLQAHIADLQKQLKTKDEQIATLLTKISQ